MYYPFIRGKQFELILIRDNAEFLADNNIHPILEPVKKDFTALKRSMKIREANLEYLPSQFLCELIKKIGFHGIIYESSIADGNNYVIFNDKKLKANKLYQYKISDVTFKTDKIT